MNNLIVIAPMMNMYIFVLSHPVFIHVSVLNYYNTFNLIYYVI